MTDAEMRAVLAERWRWFNWLSMWNLVATFYSLGLWEPFWPRPVQSLLRMQRLVQERSPSVEACVVW